MIMVAATGHEPVLNDVTIALSRPNDTVMIFCALNHYYRAGMAALF